MDGRSFNVSPLISEQEENDNSGPESPPSTILNDMKMTSISSPRRSKRGVQKRVVSVPIKDVDGIKLKGENAPPPSDSWAWRKYGQKPIKGSPYPRGYYRCSSSKGCPARKQVEKSKADPTMLVVTYSCEHNHPWPPPSRTHHHKCAAAKPEIKSETPEPEPEPEAEDKMSTDLAADQESSRATTTNDDHELISWFGHEMETTSSVFQTTPIFAGSDVDADVAMFFPMREEDESLFADLGELPECSSVFKYYHRGVGPQAQIC